MELICTVESWQLHILWQVDFHQWILGFLWLNGQHAAIQIGYNVWGVCTGLDSHLQHQQDSTSDLVLNEDLGEALHPNRLEIFVHHLLLRPLCTVNECVYITPIFSAC